MKHAKVFLTISAVLIGLAMILPQAAFGWDADKVFQGLEELKLKEIGADKFAFKSLSGDLIEIGQERHLLSSQPYLKLNKWDGEVSLKVVIPYGKNSEKSLTQNRLRLVNHKYDVVFYPREPEEIEEEEYKFTINEQGGVEFDVILKERPESNIFEFPIESRGLKFYYQPELTQEEKDMGAFQPENVIGSYAVYHETQDKLFKTSEEAEKYKAGKAFHIYRPGVKDAEGNEIWGELNIDNGILTITIDQDWMNEAVYPVRIDPNFGYETIGGTWLGWAIYYNNLFKYKANSGGSGEGTSITVYIGGANNVTCKCALYDSDRNLVTNGGTEERTGLSGSDWYTFNFPTAPSISLADYYLCQWGGPGVNGAVYGDAADSPLFGYETHTYDGWPSSITEVTTNKHMSIYCTYAGEAIQTWALTVESDPTYGGTVTKDPDQAEYEDSTTVKLTAIPAEKYEFVNWSGALTGTANPDSIIMVSDTTVTAHFVPTDSVWTLTVDIEPSGAGTVTRNPDQPDYIDSSSVVLTAVAAAGYRFHHWEGDLTGTTNPETILIDSNKTVTAHFLPIWSLTVEIDPPGAGTVTRDPDFTTYDDSSTVKLTAIPAGVYVFDYWSGDLSGTANPDSILMSSAKTVTAHFVPGTISSDWLYSKPITISGSTEEQTDYQVKVGVSFVTGQMNSDFSDIRFTSSDGTTLLDYWMESHTPSDTALFWVEVPSIPVAGTTIYMYYGNAAASAATDGYATFLLFDDFDDGTIDYSKWGNYGCTESDGYLKVELTGKAFWSNTTYSYKALRTSTKFFGHQEASGSRWMGWGSLVGFGNDYAIISTSSTDDDPVDAKTKDTDTESTSDINPVGEFNVYEILWREGEVKFTVDDILKATHTTQSPADEELKITWYIYSGHDDIYSDWISVRNYVSPEPSVVEEELWTLTVNIDPSGGGTVARNPDQDTYDDSISVELTATPAEGYRFLNWSGDLTGTANPDTILMDSIKTVTAHFIPIWTFTVDVDPAGSGTVAKNPDQAEYADSTTVELTATAEAGYRFDQWSGDLTGTANPDTILMDSIKTVTAHFVQTWTLTVGIDPADAGTVTKDPDQAEYADSTTVELTAIPLGVYCFDHWSGDLTGTTNPETISMDSVKIVTAYFVRDTVSSDWLYSTPVSITGSTEEQTDYQVRVAVNFVTSEMDSAFSDIRFTPANEKTLLDHWIESYTLADAAVFWVKFPVIPQGGTTIDMYYGNPTATPVSNGYATFLFFDNFDDGIIDSVKWSTSGNAVEEEGYLKLQEAHTTLSSIATYTYKAMRTSTKFFGFQEDAGERWIGWGDLLAYYTQGKPFANIYTGMSADAPVDAKSADTDVETTAGINPVGEFNVYEILWKAGEVKFTVDDELKATHTGQVPAVEKKIYYYLYSNGHDDIYVDWALVRNYVSPEPMATVVGITDEDIELPKTFSLFQNYPNPFNPGTTIKFDLPQPSHVTLVIYNLIGQEVATLVDRPMEAGYAKEVRFYASDIPSGIYFYRLTADDFVDTKKMIVMK